jgi:hypothetical protein
MTPARLAPSLPATALAGRDLHPQDIAGFALRTDNRKMTRRDNLKLAHPFFFANLFITWAEDKALLESNLSAATGDHTERQGVYPAFSFPASPVVSTALNSGGVGAEPPHAFGLTVFRVAFTPLPE